MLQIFAALKITSEKASVVVANNIWGGRFFMLERKGNSFF